jgi:large subunit ribosomal protein L17
MRHRVAYRKLGRITPHRIAMLRNLATALFERERIQTTLMKAKELRPYAEKLITLAKRDDARLSARRQVARDIHDDAVVKKLFDTLSPRYATRPGGYTRILRLGPRKGDGAEMAIVELLGSEYQPEKKAAKGAAKQAEPKAEKAEKAEKAAKPAKKKKDAAEAGEKKSAKGKAKGKKAAAAAE